MEVVENTELNQPGSDAVEPVVVSQQMDENAMDTTTITKEKAIPRNMQARKVEEVPAPVALTKDYLVKVGDFTSPETVLDEVAENALVLGSLIAETRDFDLYPDMIADHYVKMFEQLSIQIPVIAATLIAVQQDAPSFVGVILRKLETALLNSVQQDYVAVTKLLLRSLACLVSCRVVSVASFTNILKMLCQVIANGIDNMQLSEEGEVAAYLLAVSIPWVAETLASVQEGLYVLQDCHKMLKCALSTWKSPFCVGGTQAVLFRCSPIEEDSSPWLGLVQDSNGTSDTLEESIKVSCSLLEELFANAAGCKLPDCVIATWKVAEVSENIQFDSMNPNELQDSFLEEFRNLLESSALGRRFRDNVLHGSVSSSIGDARSAGKYTSWLHGRVPIFTADCSAEAEICAKLSYAEKSTIFGYYQDIMMFFDPIINDDGTKLGNIDMMIDHLWAVKSLFAEDHHIEFLLGEFLFNMLLQQPFNSAQHAQVSRIILQLCRKYGSAFTPVVGLATNLLWNMLPDLDMGSLRQFAEWFSFYWVNTKYCWPYWAHWENECNVANTTILDNASDEELIPAKYSILFCRQFLSKSSRIIANEKLVKVLPEFFHQYLPKQDTPAWYFTSRVQSKDCSTDVKSVVTQLQTMLLERKHGGDEVLKFLLEVPKLVEDDHQGLLCQIFIEVLMFAAWQGETLTAMYALLERYSEVIRALADELNFQLAMIERISTCYAPNEEFLVLLLDEMLRRNLLEARALAIFLTNKEGLLPVFAGLQSDHKSFSSMSSSIYQLYEMTMDRSLDYVRAAIYARKELGDDMVLDESLNLTPCNFPDEDEREIVKEDLTEQPVEHDDAENNLDDDLDERRTRRRLNEAQEFAENEFQAAENTVDNISNRLWAADEAVKSSVRNCRDVYASLFKYFELVGKLENGGSSVSSRDLLRNASQSLALRLKRNFEGAQNALSKELNQKVVIV